MHEKMTDEWLEQAKKTLTHNAQLSLRDGLFAHIAALTAERDEADANETKAWQQAQANADEVKALRERVQALEREVAMCRRVEAELRKSLDLTEASARALEHEALRNKRAWEESEKERHDAESRLAAIRQRSGDKAGLSRAANLPGHPSALPVGEAVVRYLLGEDKADECACPDFPREVGDACRKHLGSRPQVSELDGLQDDTRAGQERICEHDVVPCTTCHPPASPEPTVAEAFATLRSFVDGPIVRSQAKQAHAAADALSLLERRMGAMGRVADEARTLRSWRDNGLLTGPDVPALRECWQRLETALSALTDAPPVFTLEEVKDLERIACTCRWKVEAREQHEHGCPGWFVAERLAALRKP